LYVPSSQPRLIIFAVLPGVADRLCLGSFETATKLGSPLPLSMKNRTVAGASKLVSARAV
jgi:hypothetical protein